MSLRNVCTICYENFKRDEEISSTNCGHIFHKACIQQWLNRDPATQKCPFCMKPNSEIKKLYLDFEEDKLPATEAKLEQCIKKRSKLKRNLKDTNENLLALQKHYSEFEASSNEQIAYLTLESQCRLNEIIDLKIAQSEHLTYMQGVMEQEIKKKENEFNEKLLLLKEEKSAHEHKINNLHEKYLLRCKAISDINKQRSHELLKVTEENCEIMKSNVDELAKKLKSLDTEFSDITTLSTNTRTSNKSHLYQ